MIFAVGSHLRRWPTTQHVKVACSAVLKEAGVLLPLSHDEQVRSVEARLAEEQAEGVSLRRQLAATAGAREDAAGAAGGWPQRVRDLEFALEAAREQVGMAHARRPNDALVLLLLLLLAMPYTCHQECLLT